ncbi:hypothetical protein [Acinetobacter gerneri]|uniref:hypothetical protein n=1 Tax=Acinetobacter gerneri TaxID=202952 RepID=UPI00321441C9
MRTLQFSANCQSHSQIDNSSDAAQQYVTTLLSEKLSNFGFQTDLEKQASKVEVRLDDHPVAISVICDQVDDQGHLLCRINAHAEEEQPWFKKIETQSMIKQLASAVENTLKDDAIFSEFEWKA